MAISTVEGLIQGLRVIYEVDPDAGTVMGTIDDYNLHADAAVKVKRQLMSVELNQEALDLLRIDSPVVAIARCHPNDTFDANIGIHIVECSLNAKLDKVREKAFLRYYDYISKHLLAVEKCLKKYAVTNKPADAMTSLHSMLVHGYRNGYE